jgi:hypothetical protein
MTPLILKYSFAADAIVRSYEDWKEGAVGQGKRATGDDAALIQAVWINSAQNYNCYEIFIPRCNNLVG